jgi:hypothetical protein
MQRATHFTRVMLIVSLAFAAAFAVTAPRAKAGFVFPPDNMTTVVDNLFQFKGKADYVAPPAGQINIFGGVQNWDPFATEVNQGGQMFSISITGRHVTSPHGEPVPGPVLSQSVPNVVAGGPQLGPFTKSATHGGHTDWMQVLFAPIDANTSRLYVQLDHVEGVNPPLPLDPTTFNVPEPASVIGAACASGLILLKRQRQRRR